VREIQDRRLDITLDAAIAGITRLDILRVYLEEVFPKWLRHKQRMSEYFISRKSRDDLFTRARFRTSRDDGNSVHTCDCGCGQMTRNGWNFVKGHSAKWGNVG